jgi:hypothetical protein
VLRSRLVWLAAGLAVVAVAIFVSVFRHGTVPPPSGTLAPPLPPSATIPHPPPAPTPPIEEGKIINPGGPLLPPLGLPPQLQPAPTPPIEEGKIINHGGPQGQIQKGEIVVPGSGASPDTKISDAAEKMKALRKAIEALPKGNIALRAPTKMTVGDQSEVKASVGFNVPIATLEKQLGLGPSDQKIEGELRLSGDMAATLHGSGFTIEPPTPAEQQSIAEGFPTVWSWNVTAKQEGEEELEASLYVVVGDGARILVETYTQKINVSVRAQTWSEWLKSLGDELGAVKSILVAIGGIVTLILGWLGIKRMSPHKKRPPKNPPIDETTN